MIEQIHRHSVQQLHKRRYKSWYDIITDYSSFVLILSRENFPYGPTKLAYSFISLFLEVPYMTP